MIALSPQQKRVAELVAKAWTNREIAQILDVSVETVKVHVKAARRRTGARNRVDLALVILRGNNNNGNHTG